MSADDPDEVRASLLSSTPLRRPDRIEPTLGMPAPGADDDLDPEIPPLPAGLTAQRLPDERERRSRLARGRALVPVVVAVIAVGGFAAAVWWAYERAAPGEREEVPLIVAEKEPEKVPPASEGGLEVPFQEETIYEKLDPGSSAPVAEQILPPPETPSPQPAPASPPTAPALLETLAAPEPTGGAPVPEIDLTQIEPPPLAAAPEAAEPAEETPAAPAAGNLLAVVPTKPVPPGAVPPAVPVEAAPLEATPPEVALTETVPPEAALAEAVPATGAPVLRVQLASFKTAAIAHFEWQRLQRKFPGLLGGMEKTVLRADVAGGGVYYRLQAGPLPDLAAAQALCAELERNDQDCIVPLP